MPEDAIAINVKLFAIYQEVCGASELTLQFPPGTTAAAALESILTRHPELRQWQDVTRFGLNYQFVEPDTVLQNGDEIVFIPPVSGG